MNFEKKKVVLRAVIDGENCVIKSDMVIADGQPNAVLFWGDADMAGLKFARLDQSRLAPSLQQDADFDYLGSPIPLEKDLLDAVRLHPERKGFEHIPASPRWR